MSSNHSKIIIVLALISLVVFMKFISVATDPATDNLQSKADYTTLCSDFGIENNTVIRIGGYVVSYET
jgi:hypothetical protein